MDVLGKILNKARTNNLIAGLGNNDDITHLLYADDAILFCEANEEAVKNLKHILNNFGKASGLKINLTKSYCTMIGDEDNHTTDLLMNTFGCKKQSLPWNYLGLPLCKGKPSRACWEELLKKFDKRLAKWKSGLLSAGGRLVMIKATLSALPLHFMAVFKIPTWVINKIDRIRRNFLWFGGNKGKGFVPVAWRKVTSSKEEGGLGIRDLEMLNDAMLCKQWWKLINGFAPVWGDLVFNNYYRRRKICSEAHGRIERCSFFWNSVLKMKGIFNSFAQWLPGDGNRILFWHCDWGSGILKHIFPSAFRAATNKEDTLKDATHELHDRSRAWNLSFNWEIIGDDTLKEIYEMSTKILPPMFSTEGPEGDKVTWKIQDNGQFNVNGLYICLNMRGIAHKQSKKIGTMKLIPPKVKFFLWLLSLNRLPTRDNLIARLMRVDEQCVLCGNPESAEHLFTGCIPAVLIWYNCFTTPIPLNLEEAWAIKREEFSWWVAFCWIIWNARNKLIFDKISPCLQQLVRDIKFLAEDWNTVLAFN